MHSDDQLPMREILKPRAIPTSHDQAFQLWKHGINYPLFVPNLGPGVVELLQRGAVRDFLVELQRRAELGSDGAASLLAYLSIQGISLDPRASSFATERCHAAAIGGDGYAQFVFAWTRRKLNDDAGALEWMMKAARRDSSCRPSSMLAVSWLVVLVSRHPTDVGQLRFCGTRID